MTDAATQVSPVLEPLLEPRDYQQELYADSAYSEKSKPQLYHRKAGKTRYKRKVVGISH